MCSVVDACLLCLLFVVTTVVVRVVWLCVVDCACWCLSLRCVAARLCKRCCCWLMFVARVAGGACCVLVSIVDVRCYCLLLLLVGVCLSVCVIACCCLWLVDGVSYSAVCCSRLCLCDIDFD